MEKHTPQKLDGRDKRSERFGPIALTRHVKDDGRALLLYTRRHDGNDHDNEDDRGDDGPAQGRRV